jgi:mono/diheme cytochrome c family protein
MKALLTSTVIVAAFLASGCDAGKNQTNVELIQDMMDQINLKSQDYDKLRGEPSFRLPPENTLARGKTPDTYAADALGAERNLTNPYAGKVDEAVLARGKEKFTIYCSVCHGTLGHAAEDSRLKPYIPAIKPLVSDTVKSYKDGRIYHIITYGQGVMGSYASQVPSPEDRWAIVSYVRTLK